MHKREKKHCLCLGHILMLGGEWSQGEGTRAPGLGGVRGQLEGRAGPGPGCGEQPVRSDERPAQTHPGPHPTASLCCHPFGEEGWCLRASVPQGRYHLGRRGYCSARLFAPCQSFVHPKPGEWPSKSGEPGRRWVLSTLWTNTILCKEGACTQKPVPLRGMPDTHLTLIVHTRSCRSHMSHLT